MFGRKSQPTVANLPTAGLAPAPTEAAVERAGRGGAPPAPEVLRFRGHAWVLRHADPRTGRRRYAREQVVDGRIVENEVEVQAADLDPQPDGTVILRGR